MARRSEFTEPSKVDKLLDTWPKHAVRSPQPPHPDCVYGLWQNTQHQHSRPLPYPTILTCWREHAAVFLTLCAPRVAPGGLLRGARAQHAAQDRAVAGQQLHAGQRVSGRANTPSWVYRRRLTGRLWNTASCLTAAPLILITTQVSMFTEVLVLLRRHAVLTIRDPTIYLGRAVVNFMSCLFFAVVYIESRDYVQSQVRPRSVR
jgi:hypothetical protein